MNNCVYQCYGFTVSLAWVAVEYVFLIIIQVAAFILALLNWKVKIKTLNDAKEMMVIVYTTSAIMVVVGIITFALGVRSILNDALVCLGIMFATTVFLALTFVPKVRSEMTLISTDKIYEVPKNYYTIIIIMYIIINVISGWAYK